MLAEYSEKRHKTKKRSLWPASCKTTEIANTIHNLGTDLYSDSEDEKAEESLEKSSSEDREYRCHKKYFHFVPDTLNILTCKDTKYLRSDFAGNDV